MHARLSGLLSVRRWVQLRFCFDSTTYVTTTYVTTTYVTITYLTITYLTTTYVTTGLLHYGLNKQVSVTAVGGLRYCELNDLL